MPPTSSFYFSLHISPLHLRRLSTRLIKSPHARDILICAAEQLPRLPLDPLVSQEPHLGPTLTVPSAPAPCPCQVNQVCVWAWAVSGGKEVEPQFLDRIATCFAGPRGCGMSVCFCHGGAGRVMESIHVALFDNFSNSLHVYSDAVILHIMLLLFLIIEKFMNWGYSIYCAICIQRLIMFLHSHMNSHVYTSNIAVPKARLPARFN